jgi:hypothetical protein
VRVHIYRLDPFATDHNGQFLACRLLCMRTLQQPAAAEHDAGRGGSAAFQEITACGHDDFLPGFCLFLLGAA